MTSPTKHYGFFAVVILASLLLAACGGQSTTPATNTAGVASAAQVKPTEGAATETVAPASTGDVSFSKDVLPILNSKCSRCHGDQRSERMLKLNSYANVMAGSENGPVVTPSNALKSLLVELVSNGVMPKSGDKLTAAEIQALTDWVNAGANDN